MTKREPAGTAGRNTGLRLLGHLFSTLACAGMLASCGGGGGGGTTDTLPRVQPASASQIVDTENGKIVSGYLEAYSAEGVSTTTVKEFVKSSGWKIVGYVEAARMFQIDTGETNFASLAAARDKAIASGHFGTDVYYVTLVGENTNQCIDASKDTATYWNYDAASIKSAWALLSGSPLSLVPVQVAVADQGFTTTTAADDLVLDKVFSGQSEADCKNGCSNHGYHVAGIIGATANEKGIVGIPNALTRNVINGAGGGDSSSLGDGISSLVMEGPRVINMSIGNSETPNGKSEVVSDDTNRKILSYAESSAKNFATLLKNLIASNANQGRQTDMLIVQASGNAGASSYNGAPIPSERNGFATSANPMDAWARQNIHEKAIIVGAYDKNKKVATYTQLPVGEQGKANFILAPGDAIYSTTRSGLCQMSGTSMATPHVSGVAALVWTVNPGLSANQVRNIILNNSDEISHQGAKYRALNAEKAVRAALETLGKPTATITILTPTPTAGTPTSFRVDLAATPNGGINAVEWDFGDGTPPVLSGLASEFRHTYSAAGSYALKLKIKDARGVENTISGSIAVAASAASGSLDADALFAGTYYDYVDNGAAGKCYYKTAGSPVGVRTYSVSEEAYCLENGKWKKQTFTGSNVILSASGEWIEQKPQIVVNGKNTFSVRFGGSEFHTGVIYPEGEDRFTQVLTRTRNAYRIYAGVENNYIYKNIFSLAQLVDDWNSTKWNFTTGEGPWLGANSGQFKFYFRGGGQAPGGEIDIIDISRSPPSFVVTTIWSRVQLGSGTEAILLGPKSTLLSGRDGVQKFYVKRPGRSGVEEGDMELAGGSDSIQSMTKSGINAYLVSIGLPAVAN